MVIFTTEIGLYDPPTNQRNVLAADFLQTSWPEYANFKQQQQDAYNTLQKMAYVWQFLPDFLWDFFAMEQDQMNLDLWPREKTIFCHKILFKAM